MKGILRRKRLFLFGRRQWVPLVVVQRDGSGEFEQGVLLKANRTFAEAFHKDFVLGNGTQALGVHAKKAVFTKLVVG